MSADAVYCTRGHQTEWPHGREQLPCGCVRSTATAEALQAAGLGVYSLNELRRIHGMPPQPTRIRGEIRASGSLPTTPTKASVYVAAVSDSIELVFVVNGQTNCVVALDLPAAAWMARAINEQTDGGAGKSLKRPPKQ